MAITNKIINVNKLLPQLASSDPSLQSVRRSQTLRESMQLPSWHVNSNAAHVLGAETVTSSNCKTLQSPCKPLFFKSNAGDVICLTHPDSLYDHWHHVDHLQTTTLYSMTQKMSVNLHVVIHWFTMHQNCYLGDLIHSHTQSVNLYYYMLAK